MRLKNLKTVMIASALLLIGLSIVGWVGYSTWTGIEEHHEQKRSQRALNQNHQRRALLAGQLETLLSTEEQANLAAVTRAEDGVTALFLAYANRTPKFSAEVTGFWNRTKFISKRIQDKLQKTDHVADFSAELFSKNIVTDEKLSKDLQGVVSQFRGDLNANRNRLLGEAALRIAESDMKVADVDTTQKNIFEKLSASVQQQISIDVKKQQTDILWIMVGTAMAETVTQILVTSAVRTAVVLVGGTGSIVPGVGTVIGFITGTAIGMAIDTHTMHTKRLEIEIGARRALDKMQADLWRNPTDGLETKFKEVVKLNRDLHARFLNRIISGEKV